VAFTSFRKKIRRERSSFRYAWQGLRKALQKETHLRFHASATLAVVLVGVFLPLTRTDWALLALAMGAVWCAELLNTAIERLTDLVSPGPHPLAGEAKDVAAAAVLVTAAAAAAVGALILGPALWNRVGGWF
jgi:diacylglycerol kinase